MDATTVALLLGAGLVGGLITAMVGGSSLITFPALLAVGLPPVAAAASNTVSMMPSNFIAAMADFNKLPRWRPAFAWIVLVSIVGSGVGAWLLFRTPERAFMGAIPVLIAGATLLFAFQEPIKRWTLRHSDSSALHTKRADLVGLALLTPVAVYVGYFGAAAGVMLLAILSLGDHGDFRTVNVLKNLIGGAMSIVAATLFIAAGLVDWPHAMVMGGGGLIGGYTGGRMVRIIPTRPMRYLVIAVGCVISVIYARRFWSG
ncbi:MAG TPA: sulfite exporter TauE/SafE family protein [Casimicrobiaceae bacterium]|nr:sulfite exporter TauE/SafE family protein [Casimicrobiaceae bacterium]